MTNTDNPHRALHQERRTAVMSNAALNLELSLAEPAATYCAHCDNEHDGPCQVLTCGDCGGTFLGDFDDPDQAPLFCESCVMAFNTPEMRML